MRVKRWGGIVIFLFLLTSCTQYFTDTGERASNALCSGINPIKPRPGLQDLKTFDNVQDPSEDCLFTFRRTIRVNPGTDQDDKQVRIELNPSIFDYSKMQSDGVDLRFLNKAYIIFYHWVEIWNPLGTSVIWVRVPTAGTEEFFMVYGNSLAVDSSDSANTFAYSTERSTYYYLQDSGASTLSLGSYTQGNRVTANTSGGPSSVSIALNSIGAIANAIEGVISSYGAITGRPLNSGGGHDMITPLVFQNSQTGYPFSRGTDHWDLYNPGSQSTSLTIYNYDGSGNLLGSTIDTLLPGQRKEIVYDVNFGIIESDQNILTHYSVGDVSDGAVLMPSANEIIGINSNTCQLGILQDGTSGTIYYSDGTIVSFLGNRGDTVTAQVGNGTQGAASTVHIVASSPIIAASQADGDGSDTAIFYPVSELDREYIIPTDSQYLAVGSLHNSTITVYNADTSEYGTCTTTSDGLVPANCYFGTVANSINFSAGSRIVSDKPFFIYYEYDNQDETNAVGPKHGRLLSFPEPTIYVGPEYKVY